MSSLHRSDKHNFIMHFKRLKLLPGQQLASSWIPFFIFLCLIDDGLAKIGEGTVTLTYQYLNNHEYVVPTYNRYEDTDPRRLIEKRLDSTFPPPPSLPPPPPNKNDEKNYRIRKSVYSNYTALLMSDSAEDEHPCDRFLRDAGIGGEADGITGPPRVIVGPPGPPGPAGRDGSNGRIGLPGLPGRRGAPGATGRPGAAGPPGGNGLPGLPGVTGPKGEPGFTGPEGPQGPRGLEGRKGRRGKKGDRGEQGKPGQLGPPGIQGPPGAPGRDGVQGGVSSKGSKGDAGISGSRGRPGFPGPQGMPGEKGEQGDAGIPGMVIFPNAEAMYGVRLEGLIAYRSDVKQLYFRDHVTWRSIRISKCGDGVLDRESDEECDDGNEADDDDCTTSCKRAQCGDGIKHWYKEECDGHDFGTASCSTWRPGWSGRVVCTARCRVSYHRCMRHMPDR